MATDSRRARRLAPPRRRVQRSAGHNKESHLKPTLLENRGVPLDKQAEYINESDWIAYKDSRVRSVAQYKLVDEPDVASFQTGLRFRYSSTACEGGLPM